MVIGIVLAYSQILTRSKFILNCCSNIGTYPHYNQFIGFCLVIKS